MDKNTRGLDKFLRRQEETAERLLDTMERAWPMVSLPIQHPIHEPRRPAKQPADMLQIDVDAAKKDLSPADAGRVRLQRRIKRNQRDLVPHPLQRRRQRIVAHATAAVHPPRAGSQNANLHENVLRGLV